MYRFYGCSYTYLHPCILINTQVPHLELPVEADGTEGLTFILHKNPANQGTMIHEHEIKIWKEGLAIGCLKRYLIMLTQFQIIFIY